MTAHIESITIIVFALLTLAFGQNQILETSASCDDRFMYFRINFQRPFQGLIYTENGFPSCVYANGSSNPTLSYDVKIPLTSCRTQRAGNGNFENSVIVQENRQYLEVSDRKFLLTCVPGASSSRDGSFTVNFGGVTVHGNLPTTEIVRGTGVGQQPQLDYNVEIRLGRGTSGQTVVRPLDVGEQISYVVRIPDLKNTDVRIGRCWATDGNSEIQLSDDQGCSIQTAGNVWGSFQQKPSGPGRIFYNEIKAWAFPTSQKVNILCNLHICAGKCQVYSCPVKKRNRRNKELINDDDDAIEVINAGFKVQTSLRRTDTLTADFLQGENPVSVVTADPLERSNGSHNFVCLNRLHFIIGVSLMLIIVIISLTFLFVVAYRSFCRYSKVTSRSRHSPTYYTPRASVVSDLQSVTS